jgi:hypothetical protein
MGLMEALLLLKKRGILLAIVSKNDEQYIESHWNQIVQGQIALADFAVRKKCHESLLAGRRLYALQAGLAAADRLRLAGPSTSQGKPMSRRDFRG